MFVGGVDERKEETERRHAKERRVLTREESLICFVSESPAQVWLAEWQDRMVALKRLHEHVRQLNDNAINLFDAEARIIRSLRHRNIIFFFGMSGR